MPAPDEPVPFFIDAHHYSGGLRVTRLGTDPARPTWAPDPSQLLVGFRDEVPLTDDDAAVEFARFRLAGRHLTWVGVYRRAVDTRLGDRGNHAGVGVWLLEQDVREPRVLLKALSSFAAHVAEDGPVAVGPDADLFASGDYLPRYVRARPGLPASLAGWPYSEHMSPDTRLFLADGPEADRFDRAAEQLLRCSILPAPGPDVARAIILMRAATTDHPTASRLDPLRRGVASDVMDGLPQALAEVSERYAALDRRASDAEEERARADAALSDTRGELARANERVTILEAQVADSDLLSRLARIDSGLNFLDSAARRTEGALDHLRREVARVATASATARRAGSWEGEAGSPSIGHSRSKHPPHPVEPSSGGLFRVGGFVLGWIELLAIVTTALVVAALGYLLVSRLT